MFKLFQKKQKGAVATIEIDGMHCTSCAMSIDSELEELQGVHNAETSYAKSKTTVEYDPAAVGIDEIKKTIESLQYKVTKIQ